MKKKFFDRHFVLSLVLICILFSSKTVLSQEYRNTFTAKYNFSKDSARTYSDKLIQSKKTNIKAFGYITKGYVLAKEGDYESAEEIFNLGFREINKIENTNSKSKEKLYALYYYSNYLLEKHDIEKANETISEGLELSKKLSNAELQIKFKSLRGRSFSIIGLSKEAIANSKETIEGIKSLKSELPESFYNNELLRAYLNAGNRTLSFFLFESKDNEAYLDSTAHYFDAAQQLMSKSNFNASKVQKRQAFNLHADLFFFKRNFKKAIEYYNKALKISKALRFKKRIYQVKFRLAESHFHLKEYEKAKKLFDEISVADLNEYKLLKNTITINYYYARIYSKLGEIEKALKYTDKYNTQTEDFHNKMSSTKINIFIQSELDEKKQILTQLAQEEKTSDYLIIILLSIFLLFIILMVHTRNQRKKFQHKIKLLLENIENAKESPSITTKVNEVKAQKILLKLEEVESQELFLSKEYSLNMIAKKIDSNSSYVSQIINTYWKKSFVQYTNELRINYILRKLKEDQMYQKFTLLAIAESVGYKSLSSFNKHFKIITGISPKKYLQYLKTNSDN